MAKRESVRFAAQQVQNLASWLQEQKRAKAAQGFAEREMSLREREGALQELLGRGTERRAKRGERRKGEEASREAQRWGWEQEGQERAGMTPEQLLEGQGGALLESMGGLGGIPIQNIGPVAGVADLASTLRGQQEQRGALERGQAPLGGPLGDILGIPGGTTYEQLVAMGGASPFAGLQGRKAGIEAAAAGGGQAPAWGPEDALRFQTNYRQAMDFYLPMAISTMRASNPELDERIRTVQENALMIGRPPETSDYLSVLSPGEMQEAMGMSSDFAQMSFEQGVGAGAAFGMGPGTPIPPGGGGPVEGLGTGMPPEFALPPEQLMEGLIGQSAGTLQDSLGAGGLHNMPGMGNLPQWQDPTKVGMPGLESGRSFAEFVSRAVAVARLMGQPEPTMEQLFEEWESAQGRQEMIQGERVNKQEKSRGGGGQAGGGGGAG